MLKKHCYNHKMDMQLLLSRTTVPTVITNDLLINTVISQGPQDEAAELFLEDGIKLDEIKEIRLERCNILHINHLWVMKSLTKLSLCNNMIEKIENLNELINLKELDLSFNHIETIENLDHLVNLEVLSLYSNNITELKGLDNLNKLQIFSIGKNLLNDWNHVLYLRKFKSLRSLNTSENACADQDGYFDYVIAFIPQLIYFKYQMISTEERNNAIIKYDREIMELEDAESAEREKLEAKRLFDEHINILYNAYVENFEEGQFFQEMFNNRGKIFTDINEDFANAYENYKETFCQMCEELVTFGLSEQKRRSSEMKLFTDTLDEEKTKAIEETRKSIESFLDKKAAFFEKITKMLIEFNNDDEDEFDFNIISKKAEDSTFEIITITKQEWYNCLKNEVIFHQQILDTLETFKTNMTKMINYFIETSQEYFSQLRNIGNDYKNSLTEIATEYIRSFDDKKKMPSNIIEIFVDEETLNENIDLMHSSQIQIIDDRESILISRIGNWFENFIENIITEENERYKDRVLEISRLLDFQDREFENLQKNSDSIINGICSEIINLLNENDLTNFVYSSDKIKT